VKLLVINADDFGLSESVNDAIGDAWQAGNLTSATLMVNAPATAHAVAKLRDLPGLGVGLHFNLTQGMPLSKAAFRAGLADESSGFCARRDLLAAAFLRRGAGAAIREELQAQYQRMQDMGLTPTHIDSHQHIHAVRPVFVAVADFCRERDLPLRIPWVAAPLAGPGPGRSARRLLLRGMLAAAMAGRRGGLRCSDSLTSIFDLGQSNPEPGDAYYARLLDRLGGGLHELMVHPARSATAMQGLTRIGAISEAEWRYLCDGSLRTLAEAQGFELATYADPRIVADGLRR